MPRVRVDGVPILDEVDRGPVAVAIQLAPLPKRLVVFVLDVGHQFGALRGHDRFKLFRDCVRRRFEIVEPREGAPGMEFALAQLRKMRVGRFAMIDASAAQRVASETRDALTLFLARLALRFTHRRDHSSLALGEPAAVMLLGFREHGGELRRRISRPLRESVPPGLA